MSFSKELEELRFLSSFSFAGFAWVISSLISV